MDTSQVDWQKVGLFLGLAFGISWTSSLVLYLLDVNIRTLSGTVSLVVFFMWAPAVAAISVRLLYGESVRRGTGFLRGRLRWISLAWLAPIGFLAVTVGVGVLFPDVSLTTDYSTAFAEQGMSEREVEEMLSSLESLPVPLIIIFVLQGLVAGLTVNALAALGEELGWRGFLLDELSTLGFWRFSLLTGFVWGFWHAPIILQGHNFPDSPVVGVFMMVVAVLAISPIYTYLTVRAESVLAAVFFHGSFNGMGSISLIYLTGGGSLLTSPVGAAGVVAALLLTAACVAHDRTVAGNSITTGKPLQPWG